MKKKQIKIGDFLRIRKKQKRISWAIVLSWLACTAVLTGCATTPKNTIQTAYESDPLEGWNRKVFQFNETVDRIALKPVANTYNRTLPRKVRDSISNFFSNTSDVYTMANDLLQRNARAGAEDFMRIAINTVFGIGGLFDIASAAGLPKHQQDFGQTLGFYGMQPGPYLVLPLLGPSTVRDAAGFLVDRAMDPLTYADPISLRNALYGVRFINTRAELLLSVDLFKDAALDKYLFVRNAYLQRRQYLIDRNINININGDEVSNYDEN